MKSFYSTGNRSLSAYMVEQDGAFAPGTVMARSEKEMHDAVEAGYIKKIQTSILSAWTSVPL